MSSLASVSLKNKALEVLDRMKEEKAIRLDSNTIGRYYTVRDLADECDFFVGDWVSIKEILLQMGVNICYKPAKGHYLGADGEEMLNAYYCDRQQLGWSKRARSYFKAVANRNSAEQSKLLKDRFNIDHEELAKRYNGSK
jgi:hypothetical protein